MLATMGTAAAAVLLLAGCGAGSDAPTEGQSPPPATSASSPSTSPADPETSGSGDDAGSASGADGDSTCAASDLAITESTGDAGAGSVTVTFTFEDTGAAACTLAGFPGVSAVGGGDGEQIGQPAERSDATYDVVTLEPGGTATAAMRMVNVASGGGPLGADCQAQPADGWRVYAPGDTDAVFVPVDGLTACAGDVDWITIDPVVPQS